MSSMGLGDSHSPRFGGPRPGLHLLSIQVPSKSPLLCPTSLLLCLLGPGEGGDRSVPGRSSPQWPQSVTRGRAPFLPSRESPQIGGGPVRAKLWSRESGNGGQGGGGGRRG